MDTEKKEGIIRLEAFVAYTTELFAQTEWKQYLFVFCFRWDSLILGLLSTEPANPAQTAKQYLKHFDLTVKSLWTEEITLAAFRTLVNRAYRGDYLTDEDEVGDYFHLPVLSRLGFECKELVLPEKPEEQALRRLAAESFCSASLELELDRIFSGKTMSGVKGNPVHYLICNHDEHDDISNYRLDRIKNLTILDEPVKPFEKLKGANGQRIDLNQYMREHIYMYSSDSIKTTFRITRSMINEVIDLFGANAQLAAEPEGTFLASAKVNRMAMMRFAQNFAPDVIVLSPTDMVEAIKDRLEQSVRAYE